MALDDGTRQIADVADDGSQVRHQPSPTLAIEVLCLTGFLREYHDVVEVVYKDMLAQQTSLQLLVVPIGVGRQDVSLKPVEVEGHC